MAEIDKTRQRIIIAAMVVLALVLAGMTIYNTFATRAENAATDTPAPAAQSN